MGYETKQHTERNNGMNAKEKAMANYVRYLLREVEASDSPGLNDKWSLEWRVSEWHESKIGIGFRVGGFVTVSVNKECSNGIIDLKLEFGSAPYTCRFVNKALRKEIVDFVKPLFGNHDTKKKVA